MIELRPYQQDSIDGLRSGIRAGNRAQILVAPTGAGKTICGAYLMQEVQGKGRKAAFVVDRVALCEQTSKVLWDFGIRHGVAQGNNTFGRHEDIQVCSSQTIEKRGFLPDLDLLIVDECHTLRKFIIEFVQRTKIPVVGLTATPFSKGLGKIYSNVVNVTTTDTLIEQKYLAPLKVYAAKEIDMSGAKVIAGEWSDRDVEDRGKAIIGDIVEEWEDKTEKHFGHAVKTIGFSATVAHGEEMCRHFQAAGYNFQQVSYRDTEDRRAGLIEEFRKPDSEIMGLISCEALAKGFDVPDILCGIGARPYRKSFSSHIQQIGRAMRSSPDKEYALWLDHCGNYLGFHDRMLELFANGVDQLDDEDCDKKPREENAKQNSDLACSCGYILQPAMKSCPSCGKERVRKNTVQIVPGEMIELDNEVAPAIKPFLKSKQEAWGGICRDAIRRKKGDIETATRFAKAQYKTIYKTWPNFPFEPAQYVDPRLSNLIKHNVIAYAKRRKPA